MVNTTTRTTTTFGASGSGSITVGQLVALLATWPSEAVFTQLDVGSNQRDGSWWRAQASQRSEA